MSRLTDTLARGRAMAESRMGATNGGSDATIHRKTGETTTDAKGLEVPEWHTVYTDRPCRISGTAANSAPYRTLTIADGVQVEVAARVASFSIDTTDLSDGDLIEITAGELSGTVWQLIEADWQNQSTARRVPVIAVERPEEWS